MNLTNRRWGYVSGAVLALAAHTAAPTVTAQTFSDYPDTKIEYFWLTATTADGLRQQMLERGPNQMLGDHIYATAFYQFRWNVTTQGPKRCNATVNIRSRVIFPKHRNPDALSPRLRYDWDRFIAQLERHEMRHIQMAYEAIPKLKAALENGPCKTAYRRAAKVEKELDKRQKAFDASPEERQPYGLLFP